MTIFDDKGERIMTGLLVKDLKLLKAQRYFFLIFMATAVWIQTFMEGVSFIIGYMSICGSMAVLNTISYDEYDNGNAFLFSLPISRKGYVLEKYVFGFLIGGGAWLFAVIIAIAMSFVKTSLLVSDIVIAALMHFALLAVILAVMLPVQLKFGKTTLMNILGGVLQPDAGEIRFGGEKRVYVIFGIAGIAGIIGFIAIGIVRWLKIDLSLIFNRLSTVSSGIMVLAIMVIAALAVLISCRISISIMKKKEF